MDRARGLAAAEVGEGARVLIAIEIIASVVAAVGYACLCIKAGLMVLIATERTGFNFGFYMMTVIGLLALPFAIFAGS